MSDIPSRSSESEFLARPAGLASVAFGEHPDRPIPPVTAGTGDAWLAAVALGARGHYAAAAAYLAPLLSSADPVLAASAAATLAAHRRQLGGHGPARAVDARGLHRLAVAGMLDARCREHADVRSDVLLGLAADAVGLGRPTVAARLIDMESTCVNVGPRAQVRRGWVTAEAALATGDAVAAVARARGAVARATEFGSARHRIKSAIVLGAALAAAGRRGEAGELLEPALADASRLRLRSLVWPCALVLADVEPAEAERYRATAGAALHCVLRHSDPVGRKIAGASPWVPTWLFSPAPNR